MSWCRLSRLAIAHLTVDKLRELPVPYWGKTGQECIANFLDVKTARIDALIAEKERLPSQALAHNQKKFRTYIALCPFLEA